MKIYQKILFFILLPCSLLINSLIDTSKAHATYHPWWAWPGQKYFIQIGNTWSWCSVGFPAWDAYGNTYFITAAHCFRDKNGAHYQYANGNDLEIFSPDNNRYPVGFERVFPYSNTEYIDISLVQMYPGRKINAYGWPDILTRPHTASVGGQACLVGSRFDKTRCGPITELNVRISMRGYEWGHMTVDKAKYCGWHGDSGGAVFDQQGALGINNTVAPELENDQICYGKSISYFTPITDALTWLRNFVPTLQIN